MIDQIRTFIEQLQPWEIYSLFAFAVGLLIGKAFLWCETLYQWIQTFL